MPEVRKETLEELEREAAMGGEGRIVERTVPRIDLSDFLRRKPQIADALWSAATEHGFFQLANHGIPQALIDEAFVMSERFFALPEPVKAQYPLQANAGWEYKAQTRPSTGTPDQKESFQITPTRMRDLWPSGAELAGFKATTLAFERANWALGMRVLDCFAGKLGLPADYFTEAHDPLSPEYQCTLRLLHYPPMDREGIENSGLWRAGAHTDFDCLTLLHQVPGQGGLQFCPGNEASSQQWTDAEPLAGVVTCNIGDMLMRWSDDRLLSTLHRVRMPTAEGDAGDRYSIAYFCQANCDVTIEGPEKRHAPMTARDYLQMRIQANYGGES